MIDRASSGQEYGPDTVTAPLDRLIYELRAGNAARAQRQAELLMDDLRWLVTVPQKTSGQPKPEAPASAVGIDLMRARLLGRRLLIALRDIGADQLKMALAATLAARTEWLAEGGKAKGK